MNDIFIFCHHYNSRFTLIDLDDYERCKQYNWGVGINGYAISCGFKRRVPLYLNRFILNCPEDRVAHHINEVRFDNRKCNLAIVERKLNIQLRGKFKNKTSSKYVGVSLKRRDNVWQVHCGNRNKAGYCVGKFKFEIDAAIAYDRRAKFLYGETAKTNFKVT